MVNESEIFLEEIVIYSLTFFLIAAIFISYLMMKRKKSKKMQEKLAKAVETGLHEPVSLHPVINPDVCIGSGACVKACPENDVLGLIGGRGHTINASRCVGHGACFHACPTQAISLVMGSERRGVELPHVSKKFETNVPGIFIAGELGGMGLIKNAVEQGKQAVENIAEKIRQNKAEVDFDLLIIGAGPSGISASLTAKKLNLSFKTIEQDTLGGTVASFPRAKIVMTSPMELPLYGKIKLRETSKKDLLKLWDEVLSKNNISILENEKAESLTRMGETITVVTDKSKYRVKNVLLTIGRRGTPRKLGTAGENLEKVSYRLIEPELIYGKNIIVVGGGDSAVETAFLLCDENKVALSYRGEGFNRIKERNKERLDEYIIQNKIKVYLNSNVKEIKEQSVILSAGEEIAEFENDLVYVMIGGELPNDFLQKAGIRITKKFGEVVLKH